MCWGNVDENVLNCFEIKRKHLLIKSNFPVETQSALESVDSATAAGHTLPTLC